MVLFSAQISWTAECTRALVDSKHKKTMRSLYGRWNQYLERLSAYVKGFDGLDTLKLKALITLEVHNRDMIEDLARSGSSSPNSFEWLKHLRFYYDKDEGDYGLGMIRQLTSVFTYGYEYLGNPNRLVLTSLTDRCYLTLTTALSLNRGGAAQGSPGTGKTDTVKDLGRCIFNYFLIFYS